MPALRWANRNTLTAMEINKIHEIPPEFGLTVLKTGYGAALK
jgi:hypothetical protein